MNTSNDMLFSSDLWEPALEKYASATHVTIKLFDAAKNVVFGPIHSTPLFQLFDREGYDPGLFAECARQCLAQILDRPAVMVSKVHGLAVIGTSLVLDGKIVGAAVAGYVLADFSQLSEIQRISKDSHLDFARLWQVAREQSPVSQQRLTVNGELLQVLGDALLRENSRTRQYEQTALALREAHDHLESLVEQRTAAIRKLSMEMIRSQDEERRRISRELHDSVGQYLVHAKMSVESLKIAGMTEKEAKALEHVAGTLDKCLTETRTISYLLHPPLLDEVGFSSAANWYVEGFSERSGIRVNSNLPQEMKRLPGSVELVLFRILQESLTNVHRHAHTQSVDIHVQVGMNEVALEVRDHGKGMSPESLERFRASGTSAGIGLNSIRERVSELGGRLEIQSNEKGTLIRVTVPLSGDVSEKAKAKQISAGG